MIVDVTGTDVVLDRADLPFLGIITADDCSYVDELTLPWIGNKTHN